MKRKIIAAVVALAATAGTSIATAPAADAYAYWRNGYFYADTSYNHNIAGVYVKTVGRRDTARQVYYLKMYLYDTVSDNRRAAVQVRGWDKQTGKYLFYYSSPILGSSGGQAQAQGTISIPTDRVDTITVQDGIYGQTYGTNSVAVFRRYAVG